MQADISWREFVEKFMHFDDNSGFGPFFGYFGEFSSFWVNFAKFDNSPVFSLLFLSFSVVYWFWLQCKKSLF